MDAQMAINSPETSLNQACGADELQSEIARLSDNLGECEQQIASLRLMLELMRHEAGARSGRASGAQIEAKRA